MHFFVKSVKTQQNRLDCNFSQSEEGTRFESDSVDFVLKFQRQKSRLRILSTAFRVCINNDLTLKLGKRRNSSHIRIQLFSSCFLQLTKRQGKFWQKLKNNIEN